MKLSSAISLRVTYVTITGASKNEFRTTAVVRYVLLDILIQMQWLRKSLLKRKAPTGAILARDKYAAERPEGQAPLLKPDLSSSPSRY